MLLTKLLRHRNKIPAIVWAVSRAVLRRNGGPKTVQLENTNRCNLKCVMCPHRYDPPRIQEDMAFDDFTRILDALLAFGTLQTLHIQGLGEPLLHKRFVDMVRYAHDHGLKTHTITNLTVMTPELADNLVRAGLDVVAVSLDSIDPEIVAFIRQGASFDVLSRLMENLDLLCRAKERQGKTNPEIEVYMLAMTATLAEVPAMVETLSQKGVRRLCLQNIEVAGLPKDSFLPNGQALSEQSLKSLSETEQREAIQALRTLGSEAFEVIPPHIFDDAEVVEPMQLGLATCLDLWERPAIALDGMVMPCCYTLSSRALPMGNVNEQSFQDIWAGGPYRTLRWQHLTGRPPEVCRNCSQMYQVVAPYTNTGAAYRAYPHKYNAIFL